MNKAIFLGTGTSQGIPVIGCECEVCNSGDYRDNRMRTSLYLCIDNVHLLIDPGPDFRQQMLANQIKYLDAILITHQHNDHVIGLDDVRPFNFRYEMDMPIYATRDVQKELMTRFAYAFGPNPYPGAPRFDLKTISAGEPFEIKGIPIEPILTDHGGLPVLGFRFGDFVYITDAKEITPFEQKKFKHAGILVLNALRKEPHYSHLHLEAAIELAREVEAKSTFFTHISHSMGKHEQVNYELPDGFALAYDGFEVAIP